MSDEDQNWRFKGFTSGGAYNQTFSLAKPTAPNLDKATPETAKLLQNKFETDSAQYDTQRNTFTQQNGRVNAASRIIPNPSGTDWNATFGRNATSVPAPTRTPPAESPRFSFDLSPKTDQSQLNIGTIATDFYRDRVANMDLTKRDFETYGAGSDYGFSF